MKRPNAIEESVPKEFIDAANRLVNGEPYGYVTNPGPIPTRSPIWGIFTDISNKNCLFVLTKWMDGTGIFLRYYRHQVHVGQEAAREITEFLKKYSPKSITPIA